MFKVVDKLIRIDRISNEHWVREKESATNRRASVLRNDFPFFNAISR